MQQKKIKKVLVAGPVSPAFIGESIARHATQHSIGAHSIFLGQVRADQKEGKVVTAMEYSAYTEMAEEKFQEIREDIFGKYPLTCMHVYHSVGRVAAGQISLFVFTSAVHRHEAIRACAELVDRIKADVPVWGKEILADESYIWKENH